MAEAEHFIIRNMTYGNRFKIIFIKNIDNFLFTSAFNDEKHAFLRLGKHHFVSGHTRFPLRNEIKVHFNAGAGFACHFSTRTCQTGRPHILNAD